QVAVFGESRQELLCDNENFVAYFRTYVVVMRVDGNALDCAECPWGRCPDKNRYLFYARVLRQGNVPGRKLPQRRNQGKLHIDRRRGVILVLDFRFGQCGLIYKTPEYRL